MTITHCLPNPLVRLQSSSALHWLLYSIGLRAAQSQTTVDERECLIRHARQRRQIVEIGVFHGRTLGLLRSVLHPEGTLTGIDPHPPGRLGISFERWVTKTEIAKCGNGRVELIQQLSHDAVLRWRRPIDFLFIDGDHRWEGIQKDWTDWSRHVERLGIVGLHDSRSVAGREDLDSVRFTQEVILKDKRFTILDEVDSLTVLRRDG